MKKFKCTAVIVAAGNSSRMESLGNKQFLRLLGMPVLARTIKAFEDASLVDDIIIVTKENLINDVQSIINEYKFKKVAQIIKGGDTRQESVCLGLSSVKEPCLVAVHDGARPLITPKKIDEAITFANEKGNAVLGIPLSDTVKTVDESGIITGTPERKALRLIQTPQIFPLSLLKEAYKKARENNFFGTDDSSLVERLGTDVHYIFGDYNNIKITTPEDILKAESIMKGAREMRVGFGYDVHRLAEGRALILGGVSIPHEKGLEGHSDADVLIHAIMDALLGAAALGDIGKHFPDTDNSFKDIDSRILLRKVASLLDEKGFKIINIDSTIVAQSPKLAPFIEEMRANISQDLSLPIDAVCVKATTTEKLGFEGRKEGISASSVCSLL
ncbi:MAG: 2-C-methyl-D-erythritol 2,4-cyclodiphosphate synthase [Clostridia bacterium]|nr:2-C-methyl-D-erythritol 2,4-cyclodiphosphate synthase [Clostridia bacterium]